MPRNASNASKTPGFDFLPKLFKKAKSKTAVARLCRVSKVAVGRWTRVPDDHVRRIAEAYGFPLKEIRPDLYDPDFKRPTVAA